MSVIRKKLSIVEQFFAKTDSPCTHCENGRCGCGKCANFVKRFGANVDCRPGDCRKCWGTGWELKLRSVPLDENGVPVKLTPKNVGRTETGKAARIVGTSNARPRKRPPLQKPIRKTSEGDSMPIRRDWDQKGK